MLQPATSFHRTKPAYKPAELPLPASIYVHLQQQKRASYVPVQHIEAQDRGKAPKPPASHQGPTMGADHSAGIKQKQSSRRIWSAITTLVLDPSQQALAGAASQII